MRSAKEANRPKPVGLYTYGEAAAFLGLTSGTVRRYCDLGKIGYVVRSWRRGWLIRRQRLIPRRDLEDFIFRGIEKRVAARR